MYRFFLFLYGILILHSSSKGKNLDSLKALLTQTQSDTQKISCFNQLGLIYEFKDLDSSAHYFQQGLLFTQQHQMDTIIADFHHQLGKIWIRQNRYFEAIQQYEKAINIWRKQDNQKALGGAYLNLGNVYDDLGEYAQAADYFLMAEEIARQTKQVTLLCAAWTNLGNVYDSQRDTLKMVEYFLKIPPYIDQLDTKEQKVIAISNLALAFLEMNDPARSAHLMDSAMLLARQWELKQIEGRLLNNKGHRLSNLEKYEEAIKYYDQALTIRKEIKDWIGVAFVLNNMADAYGQLGQDDKRLVYAQRAYRIADSIQAKEEMMYAQRNMANAYWGLGDYKQSKDCLEAYIDLKDAQDDKSYVEALQHKYFYKHMTDSVNHQQQVELIEQDRLIERWQWLSGIGGGILLIIVIILYSKRQIARIQVEKEKQLIEKERMQMALAKEKLRGEEERLNTALAMVDAEKEAKQQELQNLHAITEALTERELEVLRLVCKGFTTNEIAEAIYRSPKTIEKHRSSLMNKLGTGNVAEMAVIATKLGLVT